MANTIKTASELMSVAPGLQALKLTWQGLEQQQQESQQQQQQETAQQQQQRQTWINMKADHAEAEKLEQKRLLRTLKVDSASSPAPNEADKT